MSAKVLSVNSKSARSVAHRAGRSGDHFKVFRERSQCGVYRCYDTR